MFFKILMLFSLTTVSCDSTNIDLLKKSNEAVIEILGDDIFNKHVKIDSSLTKFYMEDNSYDNLERYDKSINYKYASIEYTLYEDGDMIGYFAVDSNKDTVDIMGSRSLDAFKIYFENPALIRYNELRKIFKKLLPKEENLFFRPYKCHRSDDKCDECNYLRISDGLIWKTKFYSSPLSYNERGEWDYIRYNIFIDAKNPYDHLIVSRYNRTIVD